jgi:hypothetical protein
MKLTDFRKHSSFLVMLNVDITFSNSEVFLAVSYGKDIHFEDSFQNTGNPFRLNVAGWQSRHHCSHLQNRLQIFYVSIFSGSYKFILFAKGR